MQNAGPQTTDYSSWSGLLQEMLAGSVVEFPSKQIGRGGLLYAPDRQNAQWLQSLQSVPGVTFLPPPSDDQPITRSAVFVPHNLFLMGQRPSSLATLALDPVETTPSGLRLKDHQRQSVTFLRSITEESEGAILGADAGTGKSIMALQALWLDGFLHGSGLVVGPLGAQDVWCSLEGDPLKHYQRPIFALEGGNPDASVFKAAGPAPWFFIHYDILPAWGDWIRMYFKPQTIIFDELHYLMSTKGRRFKAATIISSSRDVKRRFGLTGTPIPKSRMDLFGQLAVVQPGQWGPSMYPYGARYGDGKRLNDQEGKGHWTFNGRTNTDELRARLAGVYLRYSKLDVASDLPKLVRHRVGITLTQEIQKEYRLAKRSVLEWQKLQGKGQAPETYQLGGQTVTIEEAKKQPQAIPLITTSALKSILDRGKLPQAAAVIHQMAQVHRRIVVFTWQRSSAKYLYEQMRQYPTQQGHQLFGPIDGSSKCPWSKRREVAKEFATSPLSILIATRGSVGIAINDLSSGDACLHVTPDWNPDGNLQAESRLHREGAGAPEIHSYYMLCPGTLDDRVLELIDHKAQEAASLSDADRAGMHLAADLDPTLGDDSWSMEEICSLLGELED